MEEAPRPQFSWLVKKGRLNVVSYWVHWWQNFNSHVSEDKKKKPEDPSHGCQALSWLSRKVHYRDRSYGSKELNLRLTWAMSFEACPTGSAWEGLMVAWISWPWRADSFCLLFQNLRFLSLLLTVQHSHCLPSISPVDTNGTSVYRAAKGRALLFKGITLDYSDILMQIEEFALLSWYSQHEFAICKFRILFKVQGLPR